MAPARERLRLALERLWWRDAAAPLPLLASLLLQPLSLLYGIALARHQAGFRTHPERSRHLGLPTLVVGNRIVGGAGKTPCTLSLITGLQARGWRPGIVSRGYGRRDDAGVRGVDLRTSTAAEVGDEPLLMARRSGVPVWVGRDRHAAGLALRAAHPEVDVLLCDDGLQHWALARDLELVVFDERGAGNGRLLPLGPLREPLDSPSIARRQWQVHNLAAGDPPPGAWRAERRLAGVLPLAAWWQAPVQRPALLDWAELRATLGPGPVVAVAGIGEPERFFRALEAEGLTLLRRPCADHADFDALPFEAASRDVVVTEKDAVKLDPARLARERPGTRVWVAPLVLTLPAALLDEIDAALRQPTAQARTTGLG